MVPGMRDWLRGVSKRSVLPGAAAMDTLIHTAAESLIGRL
jgi:hypothetical protein